MSEEPKWPTVEEVQIAWHDRRELSGLEVAIEMCRAAWHLANDDPAQDPSGTVRREPDSGIAYLLDHGATSKMAWHALAEAAPRRYWLSHEQVKGWPIIGAVPGTPAAEVTP